MQNDILKNSAFESCKLSNAALQVRLRQKLAITALRSVGEDLRKRGGIWRFTDKKTNAEGIGLEISFGHIKMPFLLTILIHEKVVNTPTLWLHKDTHISMGIEYREDNSTEDDTNVVKSWVQVCNTQNAEHLPIGIIDHLYQSHSCVAVLELLYVLNVLNNKI
jgi:hypothetical protein